MANALTLLPVSALAGNLINVLDLIEQPFFLVLDDFHFIKNESVIDLVTQLLHHPPQAMHLMLIGRRDPPLPISVLRAKGFVSEIRTQDLRQVFRRKRIRFQLLNSIHFFFQSWQFFKQGFQFAQCHRIYFFINRLHGSDRFSTPFNNMMKHLQPGCPIFIKFLITNEIISVVKMPKSNFRDSGLTHYIQGITERQQLLNYPNVGAAFEAYIFEEIIKGIQATEVDKMYTLMYFKLHVIA